MPPESDWVRPLMRPGPAIFVLSVAILLAGSLAGCQLIPGLGGPTVGSGRLVTRDFSVTGFSALDAGSVFRLRFPMAKPGP